VLGNRLLDPVFLGGQTNNFNPLLFDGDKKDLAMYYYMQQHPQSAMNPWMMKEMDSEDWMYMNSGQGAQQQGANAPIRAQAAPMAGAMGPQQNPAVMQALLQSDIVEDLMDNDLVQQMIMAKQMQGSPRMRGKAQGFGDYPFYGFGQPSTATTPQFYPGMDEEMMEWQMMQQQAPGTYNPLMADWDIKDWTRYNMMNQMNQQGAQNTNSAMFMDGDMSDMMMWQSIMNSKQPAASRGSRASAIEQMEKMALCQTYLNSMTGTPAQQMQAYTLYKNANDIGEDDIRDCLMMHQMQTANAAQAAPAGFNFGSSGFGRTMPDPKDLAMMAWMNKNQGEGQAGPTYYPGMDAEDMLEFNFWQKMKEQVASNKQQ
jgi:hypothetical protein